MAVQAVVVAVVVDRVKGIVQETAMTDAGKRV